MSENVPFGKQCVHYIYTMSQNQGPSKPQTGSQPRPGVSPTGQAAQWNVVVLNDDEHTFDYVQRMMQELFYLSAEQAQRTAEEIDTRGRAVAMTTHREHAELKVEQIHAYGRDPLIMASRGPMKSVLEPVA